MIHDVELLQYVYKTADMGCEGIRSVLDHTQNASLKKELEDQHNEYLNIRNQAQSLLEARDERPKGVGTVARISADLVSTGKMIADRTDSKIAEMAIEGNQMGINKTIKHLHAYGGQDNAVGTLAGRLLAAEQANAEQLKQYL